MPHTKFIYSYLNSILKQESAGSIYAGKFQNIQHIELTTNFATLQVAIIKLVKLLEKRM